ncbi:hypothetical protein M0R45_021502 [Rubus argutus]|uniref:Uncharacterized protein n=1 Tax=Rubus argutus TaxID=59490 RepID=A0AAW1XBY2_RUBAR
MECNKDEGLYGFHNCWRHLSVYMCAENKIGGEADWGLMEHLNLLKDAWDMLSDKSKRVAYDRRRNVRVRQSVVHQNVSTACQGSQGTNGSTRQKVSTASRGSQGANGSVHQKFQTAGQGSQGANGSCNVTTTKSTTSGAKAQTGTKRAAPSSAAASSDEPTPKTFWSECSKCKMTI